MTMKAIFFFGLFLTLGLSCKADEDWKEFNAQMKTEVCKPDKTDDKIMAALVQCQMMMVNQTGNFEKQREHVSLSYQLNLF